MSLQEYLKKLGQAEQLCGDMFGIEVDEDTPGGYEDKVEEKLQEEYGIEIAIFTKIVFDLIKYTEPRKSLDGKYYYNFSKPTKGGLRQSLVRLEVR